MGLVIGPAACIKKNNAMQRFVSRIGSPHWVQSWDCWPGLATRSLLESSSCTGGVARSVYVVDGDLDGTELPGVVARDGGLSMSVLAGGVAGVGPLDLLFGLRWRRVPVSGVAVHIVGPTIGLRWGP